MNLLEAQEQARQEALTRTQLAEEKINIIRAFEARMGAELERATLALVGVCAALQAQGLEIKSYNLRKSGRECDRWEAKDQLCLSISAMPINRKVKFSHFRGYDARGASKNYQRVHSKAVNMAQALQAAIPAASSVSVNPGCFELRKAEDTSRNILIDVWFTPIA